jgi:hypothetical protein
MLHRIVSRSVVVLAATAFLASCEDNTTGTPLTPPPASTAVYVNPVEPVDGYSTEEVTITIPAVGEVPAHDTVVTVVTPDPLFNVTFPSGDAAVGQVVTFNLTLPGLIAQSKDTVDADGQVSPGQWILANVCPNPMPTVPPEEPIFCRPVQSVVATPVAGNPGVVNVNASFPPIVPEVLRASR